MKVCFIFQLAEAILWSDRCDFIGAGGGGAG